jgi:NADPH:quinone reductase
VPGPALDQAVADITSAIEAGALTALPITRFPLDEIAAAHDAVEGGAVGKVVVVP